MNILILGRNPSKKNCDPNIPFLGAPCYKRLMRWLEKLNGPNRHFILANCSNDKEAKFNTKALPNLFSNLLEHILKYEVDLIIALGNDAAKVCELAQVTYYKLPHPSGLNRLFNNPRYEIDMLFKCERWLNEKAYTLCLRDSLGARIRRGTNNTLQDD